MTSPTANYVIGSVRRNATCYVDSRTLAECAKGADAVQTISLHGVIVGARLRGNTWLKRRDVWRSDEELGTTIERCLSLGLGCPSSPGDVYHRRYPPPYIRLSRRAFMQGKVHGAWEQALAIGDIPGPIYHTDQRSAYAWSVAQGLPDVAALRPVRYVTCGERAIYFGKFALPGKHSLYPPPFRQGEQEGWISSEEAEVFGADIHSIRWGQTWDAVTRMDDRVDWVQSQFPDCAKRILRAFWGSWISTEPIVCAWPTSANEQARLGKPMPLRYSNPSWGYLTVSRVKLHQWRHAMQYGAVRVYVDSLLTREPIDESIGLGGWRREAVFPAGVIIESAGRYRDRATSQYVAHSGISTRQLELALKPN